MTGRVETSEPEAPVPDVGCEAGSPLETSPSAEATAPRLDDDGVGAGDGAGAAPPQETARASDSDAIAPISQRLYTRPSYPVEGADPLPQP